MPAFAHVLQVAAQTGDPNAPYQDAYDVQTRGRLVGAWQGTISGSSISQADGQMAGQAVFVQRGYEGRNDFGIVLHDHRHRDGASYSEIHIGSIPCGPDGRVMRAVHGVELQNAPAGTYVSAHFDNRLADMGRDDLLVHPVYAPVLDNPASLQTRWSDDGFNLRLTGTFVSVVAPVRNHTFDYERQNEGRTEQLHLDVEFTLESTAETQGLFDWMMCKEPEVFQVVETQPMNGRENVVLDGADFFVEFSSAVAMGSVDPSTVTMTTRDRNDGFIFVDLEFSLEDERGAEDGKTLRIAPREPLRSGTIYEISVAGGEAGVRGEERQMLDEDYTFSVSAMVDPDDLRFGVYQVSRNAPLVFGKPAAARIQVEWEELEDIHSDWQVLDYPVRAKVLDDRDKAVFPELQRRVDRPDQLTDEDRRRGDHTLNLFGWTPSAQNDPRNVRAEITPDGHYPEDVELAPAMLELTLDYAGEHIDQLTFDYYIAEHSEWRSGADPEHIAQVVQAARQDQEFANQILPVARVRGRFRGSYNLRDTICGIPGAGWAFCDDDGFSLWDDLGEPNPARQAADFNEWDALVRLFHEHVAAHSNADILVSYHPPSLGGGGTTRTPFEQPESLQRGGDEPYWFGAPDPDPLDSLHADRTGQNTIIMSTFVPDHVTRPGILASPLVAHEFGHVFGLPHTPYAENAGHKREICQAGYRAVPPGIDGMRISLDGMDGWQKSSEHGNAQTRKPLLNLMFPCLYEPHSDYWIDPNQYGWLIENMPAMLRHTRRRRAEIPLFPRVQLAQVSGPIGGYVVRNDGASHALPDAGWIMLSGLVGPAEAMLMPAVTVPGPRQPLSDNGPYEVRVEDAAGRVLARASVGPRPFELGPWPFTVTLPVSGEPARIALLRDGEVLAERRANLEMAAPEVVSHASGATYRVGETLEWVGGRADGMTYSVRFTADGREWTTLAVLLRKPRFTPHPATLMPGARSDFEIITHDGVRERVTRLPIEIDVPLQPLATWPEDGEVPVSGGHAEIAFNVPIDADTLDGISLEANGVPVPVRATLDPSGTVVTVAPREPAPDVVYTAIAGPSLRAEDGRRLQKGIRMSFTAQPRESPGTASAQGQAWPERSSNTGDADSAGSQPEKTVGMGEVVLELGKTLTVPVRLLRCANDADGRLVHLEMDFETTPGDRVEIAMSRSKDDALTVETTLGDGTEFRNQGGEGDGWHLGMDGGQVAASGHVGGMGEPVAFAVTGECSAG